MNGKTTLTAKSFFFFFFFFHFGFACSLSAVHVVMWPGRMRMYVETDSETSYCELNTVILNSSNSSSSPLIDGSVVYKASGDNFTANHSKIITQTSDNISASYTTAAVAASSSLSSSSSAVNQVTNHINNSSSGSNSSNNHHNIARLYTTTAITTDNSDMVLQQHLHHTIPLIESDHYHDQNSPVSSSDGTLLRNSLITYMYSPYPTVTSSSSSPPLSQSNHYHQIIPHRPSGAATIDEVIADTLKDEHCTMIDGINASPNGGVLVANVTYNGSHSAANSDDGDNNSRSPNNVAHLTHPDDYDGTTLQSFTHLTNAADINQSVLNRESVYSGTALFTPNNGTTIATPSIIHPIQTYESVLHPATPGRYVLYSRISYSISCVKRKN